MKREIKDKWVAALLSGEYKQGKHALRTESGNYCCLGVLCDLAAKEGIGEWTSAENFRTQSRSYETTVLPPEVMIWAGIRCDSGALPPDPEGYSTLMGANDSGNEDFESIACAIEGCWEDL